MINGAARLIFSLTVWGLFSAPAVAFDCGSGPIKLAFYEFGLLYDQGKGIDKEIIDELERRTQCKFEAQVMPRARIWADLASGKLDMSVSGIQTPDRDQFAWFVPYLALKNYALVDVKLAGKVKTAAHFLQQNDAQFGVVRSFKHGKIQDQFLEQMRLQQRVQESPDVDTLFLKLKEGRIQGMFSQPPVFRYELRRAKMESQIQIQDWAPQQKGLPHGLILAKSRFSAEQAQAWQAQISAMRADGTLDKIYRHFLTDAEVAPLLDF